LSSYLSNGIIQSNSELYKINYDKNKPAIFNFSIKKYINSSIYITLDDNITKIIFNNSNKLYNINILSLPGTRVFHSLYVFEEIYNFSTFIKKNLEAYNNISKEKNQLYLLTGWIDFNKKHKHLIMDLLKYDKRSKKTDLIRCKIFDKNILKLLDEPNKCISGYCLYIINFISKDDIKFKYIIPITFDEYISYVYDLMLPYKYDFNNLNNKNNLLNSINYHSNNIERVAFAIDPDGSKDRDDAISAFYLKDNNIICSLKDATHIKLIVHISDTLSYITPENDNYYYHYSKYKCNTDYLDKYNLPMMDRVLSEERLSLDGDKNSAITINLIYKIIDKDNFIIRPFPEDVKIHRSKNLRIIGTTYKNFSESFNLKKEKNFDNSKFNKRFIINCNKKLVRDFNEFIYEGNNIFSNKTEQNVANNLKQLYIFFVNSLNHTGKDTLIKIPSNLIREKHEGESNIYFGFSPVDMWSHSLIEYTALESNIYFSYLMYLISKNIITAKNNIYTFDYKIIHRINELVGKKNQKLLLDNINKNKVVKSSKCGIYRNLYTPGPINDKLDFYINEEIKLMLININNKTNDYNKTIEKFLNNFNYKVIENNVTIFLKLLLALRQVLILIDSKNNLDVSYKLISKNLKMKAKYEFFPFSHIDICSIFYTHATSPMRRFVDINVHNLIFNKQSRDYIYSNMDIDGINLSVNTGKYIYQLVNNQRFLEFIIINSHHKKLVMDAILLDKRRNLIGIIELVNFYTFGDTFNLSDNKRKVLLTVDDFNLPKILKASAIDTNFNIFFHMLRKEKKYVKKKCQLFLEKIFNTKIISEIC